MPNNPNEITVNLTFRNTEPSDAVKTYANEKIINAISKYVHKNTKAHLVLSVEKNRHIAEVSFHTDGSDFQAKEETTDMYSSIDKLIDVINHQLRKNKEKMTAHHR